MKATEVIHAHGHQNITAANKTTFEITKETHLTTRGDCIIAVDSNKAANDLAPEFKKTAQNENARIRIHIEAGGETETINAWGSPQLTFTHSTDLVVRKSNYTCNRTVATRADKASKDFHRKLTEKLQNPKQKVKITLTVEKAT